jgi:ABC-type multidrug transport system ATPase subunit
MLQAVSSPRTAAEASDEIRALVSAGDLGRAGRRLLDFSKEFEVPRELENEAVRLMGRINILRRQIREIGENQDAAAERNTLLGSVLELVDDMNCRREEVRSPALRLVEQTTAQPDVREAASLALVPTAPAADVKLPSEATRFETARETFMLHRTQADDADAGAVVFRCRGLTKRYRRSGGFELVDVGFDLCPGEITGVIGVNGAGKTTVLRIVAGALRASDGTVAYPLLSRIGGHGKARIRSQIAYVDQQPAQWYGRLADSLHLYASLNGVRGRDNEDEVEFLLQRLCLDQYRDHEWHQISGGFKMRFELARALVKRPKLLVLDEPLAPLDIMTQQLFLQDLRDLADSSRHPVAIIVSSQHLYEIESIADQILFLDGGRQVHVGKLSELGSDRVDNVFELSCRCSRAVLERHLEALPVLDIEEFGTTYHVRVTRETAASDVIKVLAAVNLQVTYFRDISRSTRRMFDSRMESL